MSTVRAKCFDLYMRSFRGVLLLPSIWKRIPQEITNKGASKGTKTACVGFLTGKSKPNIHKKQKAAEKQPELYSTKLNNELNGIVQFNKSNFSIKMPDS